MDELYERDPNGSMLAFADMMQKSIVMPAHLMDDGEHKQRTGKVSSSQTLNLRVHRPQILKPKP